mmetsp:Transcript_20030/g.41175  ORF Transcript_20030/g.41175 Transcript_20030/m.41175 type:complete len:865 (+) Transcript_20030:225-2819(+)
MRFIALVSGGKDSIYSILQAIHNGHELVACLHLGAPAVDENDNSKGDQQEEESYMYQTAASEVVKVMVEECLGVEMLLYPRQGKSVNTGLVYENTTPKDEVEDLFLALEQATKRFDIEAVCSGAILSTYQRVRIEHVCNRLSLTSLSYLWRLCPQKELLRQMLDDGIEAVLVKVACPPGLVPRKHLNKSLRFLSDTGLLERLNQLYQFHVCGEGGEYESLVIDSPLHKKKLVLEEVEIVETDAGDGVGELRILSCRAEEKVEGDIPLLEQLRHRSQEQSEYADEKSSTDNAEIVVAAAATDDGDNEYDEIEDTTTTIARRTMTPRMSFIPHVYQGAGGLLHFSEIMSPVTATSLPIGSKSEAELAVEEAMEIFATLKTGLQSHGATAKDVFYVHLYLSEISHFATINAHYQAFFGSLLPPSRSCVALGRGVLPGARRVLLDCKVQIGSGEYMRSSTNRATADEGNPYAVAAHETMTSKLREVLHVQSVSNWAPICVGPYSQVNTLRSGLQFLAGQIGLLPETMALQPTWSLQLEQCWKNVASVLDALNGGSLKDVFGSLIYISDKIYPEENSLELLESISKNQIRSNGSILAGRIDSLLDETELFGGYEDQGTWEEMKTQEEKEEEEEAMCNPCPILVVSIPEMPKGALVEVEVITSTAEASRSLDTKDADYSIDCNRKTSIECGAPTGWESGHTFPAPSSRNNEGVRIDSFARVIGTGCAAAALATASRSSDCSEPWEIQSKSMLVDMLSSVQSVLAEARAGLTTRNMIHVRLFFVSSKESADGQYIVCNDGVQLRSSLSAAVNSMMENNHPATSVIPVKAIDTIGVVPKHVGNENRIIMFAMQVLLLDPVHLETEIWIHKDR